MQRESDTQDSRAILYLREWKMKTKVSNEAAGYIKKKSIDQSVKISVVQVKSG